MGSREREMLGRERERERESLRSESGEERGRVTWWTGLILDWDFLGRAEKRTKQELLGPREDDQGERDRNETKREGTNRERGE